MVTVIAVPMIYRANTHPPSKALLLQDFGINLTVLLAAIGGMTLTAYAIRVARDRSVPGRAPADDEEVTRDRLLDLWVSEGGLEHRQPPVSAGSPQSSQNHSR